MEYNLYSVNVIKPSRIRQFGKLHARAVSSLEAWLKKAVHAEWKSFAEVRATIGSVDMVRVGSGKSVLVFNIGGGAFRLICACHFNRGQLYVLRLVSHAEYDKNKWKGEL